MPRFAASLSLMFNEWPLQDRFAAARDAGFKAVELQTPYSMAPDAIAAKLQATGLELVLINVAPGPVEGDRGLAAVPGREADFRDTIERAVGYAEATGVRQMHVLSGTGPSCRADVWEANMRWAAERLAKVGVTALLEPLNKRDNPGYFLSDFAWAAAAIERLGLANLKLQFDVYHRQILHGDIAVGLAELMPLVGHVQIAGVPGRHEPDGCEIDYDYVLKEVDRLGYAGWIGCEYRPRAGTLDGLGWIERWRQEA